MILGMSVGAFTIFHVIITLSAIGSGLIVVGGMFASNSLPVTTALFLFTTALTSLTGFLFPIHGLTPALGVAIAACVILAIALFALYKEHLVGAWRWIYVITAVVSLYLNVFVLVVQSFVKSSALNALAPTQTELPFAVAQATVLAIFTLITLIAVIKFRPPKAQMSAGFRFYGRFHITDRQTRIEREMFDKLTNNDDKVGLCFVVGPIGQEGSVERNHSDLLLNAVLKHVLQGNEFGYVVKRADEDAYPAMIGDRVVSDVINAELVVADLTDLTPNALYELGIRHSTQKPTIHIAKAGTVLPFDTVTHRTIFVDLNDSHGIEQARERVASSTRAIKAPGHKVRNPITQANATFTMRQSADPRDRVIAEIQERMVAFENLMLKYSGNYLPGVEEISQDAIDFIHAIDTGQMLEALELRRLCTNIGILGRMAGMTVK